MTLKFRNLRAELVIGLAADASNINVCSIICSLDTDGQAMLAHQYVKNTQKYLLISFILPKSRNLHHRLTCKNLTTQIAILIISIYFRWIFLALA